MSFKDMSYLELCRLFCSAEQNHLCNFLRGHNEEQFCEFILNLGQWFRKRCCLKYFLSGALVALGFSGAEPFREMLFKDISYLELWQPLEPFLQFW